MSNVLLFDIDGTLLNSGGAGQHAMEQALLEVFGVKGPYEDIPAAGRTDRAITTDLFQHHQIESSESNWATFQQAYFRHLPVSLNNQDGHVLPGIVELLDHLSSETDAILGLLTGNFRTGADLKLQHYQLDHHFQFGGFGDDHFDRDDVARLAMQAANAHVNRTVPGESVWVIGDTPADVRCGRAIGAKVLAVATGIYSAEVLEQSQPDLLLTDLSDMTTVIQCLTSLN